jgi:hypothetical protein
MDEGDPPLLHDGRPAELFGVLLGDTLAIPHDALEALRPHTGPHQFGDRPLFQSQHPIALALLVDEQCEREPLLLLESAGRRRRTHTDHDDARSALGELSVMVTQLRDVLTAERSPVVTQPDQGDGLVVPKITEADIAACRIGEVKIGERPLYPQHGPILETVQFQRGSVGSNVKILWFR